MIHAVIIITIIKFVHLYFLFYDCSKFIFDNNLFNRFIYSIVTFNNLKNFTDCCLYCILYMCLLLILRDVLG